ncbi:hypothetical protein LCGC14_2650160 [marine sediment metagenome]|uniref:Uncharacterized protein n=1 Tax=marine sediment metagenome TaxID=412755 RepID=A0A0F9CM13_9ZZZZ
MTRLVVCRASETDTGNHYHREGEKRFYVTIIRDTRVGFLLGPYSNHQEAVDHVEHGRKLATGADFWADFDSFGTVSLPAEVSKRTVFGS